MINKSNAVAVVGAGIYGSTIAIKLAKSGINVDLYDKIGILGGASSINQFRVHSGYHYPRSDETIEEVISSRSEFMEEYSQAIVGGIKNYYAMPHIGSRVTSEYYEDTMKRFGLQLDDVRLDWVDYSFISKTWLVDESIYCPKILKKLLQNEIESLNINFLRTVFHPSLEDRYENVIYANYGIGNTAKALFSNVKYQLAEKIKIYLPSTIQKVSLVVVDGPFTAFDPLGNSGFSQFGSAKYTNHWETNCYPFEVPCEYSDLINTPQYIKTDLTNFPFMLDEAAHVTQLAKEAKYMGSKFTIRVVEDDPESDKRVLYVKKLDKNIYVFSGKVVGAIKAAKIVQDMILTRSC